MMRDSRMSLSHAYRKHTEGRVPLMEVLFYGSYQSRTYTEEKRAMKAHTIGDPCEHLPFSSY